MTSITLIKNLDKPLTLARYFRRPTISIGVCGLLLLGFIRYWIILPTLIQGESMLPRYEDGQLALISRLAYWQQLPQRGDVVCVWSGKELLIKRIVGLQGEVIRIREGTIYVEDKPLRESYVQFSGHWNVTAGKLGARHYAVVGDNRSLPQHQAVLAVVRKDRIVGRLIPLWSLSAIMSDF